MWRRKAKKAAGLEDRDASDSLKPAEKVLLCEIGTGVRLVERSSIVARYTGVCEAERLATDYPHIIKTTPEIGTAM
jgi:hypothetical protein